MTTHAEERRWLRAPKDSITQNLSGLEYINRMLDYTHGVHSLPGSPAVEDEHLNQAGVYGEQWDRPVCDCGLYPYEHAGCPGPAAKRLPRGWESGDDVQ